MTGRLALSFEFHGQSRPTIWYPHMSDRAALPLNVGLGCPAGFGRTWGGVNIGIACGGGG